MSTSGVSVPTGQAPVLIADLANEVCIKLENRLSLINRAYVWVRDSLKEITANTDLRDDFHELEIWGTPFNLDPSIVEYPFSELVAEATDPLTGALIPTVNAATLDVLLWTDPPSNTKRRRLDMTHYQDVDRGSPTPGTPSQWYRFGDNISFNPNPNNFYQTQARILRYHPFNTQNLAQTVVLINDDWHEVVEWGAVERGYMELQEFDKASAIHTLIHGDPKYPAKLGLLQGAKKVRKKEAWRTSGRFRYVGRGYGYGSY